MSDAMTSDEYLAHLRATGQAGEEMPAEMDAADFQRLLAAERSAGMASFISAPPDAGEKGKLPPLAFRRFAEWLDTHAAMEVVREHRGVPGRQYRFDFAIPPVKLAFEYDGINKPKGKEHAAHASTERIVTDSSKMNLAALNGWIVIRVNAKSLDRKGKADGYEHAEAALRQKGVWRA